MDMDQTPKNMSQTQMMSPTQQHNQEADKQGTCQVEVQSEAVRDTA
jgi:hypothetical protein